MKKKVNKSEISILKEKFIIDLGLPRNVKTEVVDINGIHESRKMFFYNFIDFVNNYFNHTKRVYKPEANIVFDIAVARILAFKVVLLGDSSSTAFGNSSPSA